MLKQSSENELCTKVLLGTGFAWNRFCLEEEMGQKTRVRGFGT